MAPVPAQAVRMDGNLQKNHGILPASGGHLDFILYPTGKTVADGNVALCPLVCVLALWTPTTHGKNYKAKLRHFGGRLGIDDSPFVSDTGHSEFLHVGVGNASAGVQNSRGTLERLH